MLELKANGAEMAVLIAATRSGRMTGSDRSSMASAKLNIAQVAPMPIASEPIATVVNTGSLRCLYAGPEGRD